MVSIVFCCFFSKACSAHVLSSVISTHSVYHRTGSFSTIRVYLNGLDWALQCKLSVTEEQSTIRDQIREMAKFFFLHNCETRQYSAKPAETREFPHECVKGHNASDKKREGGERERERGREERERERERERRREERERERERGEREERERERESW